jgi:hypothetical protein
VNTRTFGPSRSNTGERNVHDLSPAQVRSSAPLPPRPSTSGHDHVQSYSSQAAMADTSGESDDEYYEARSHTLQDGSDYDGYPDGNSITNGTPSRFLKHGKQLSVTTDMFFNSSDLSPQTAVHAAQRRKSSSEVASTPHRKPGFHRADTSPNYGFISRRMNLSHGRPATSDSTMSPYSYNSASSSGHTATYNRYSRSLSPEPSPYPSQSIAATIATSPSPPKHQPHPSPASRSSFSQKTHNLFRRLSNTASNHNGDDSRPTPRREREVSPLPTLTSTHSSAYQMPHPERREIRRPNTSASMRPTPARAVSRDASWSRPTISPRTMTDPNFSPPRESSGSLGQTDSSAPALKRALFRRGGSIKQADVSSVRSLRR